MLSQPKEPPGEMVSEIRARLGRMCEGYAAMRAETFFEAARFLAAERIAAQTLTDDVISRPTQT
jgi:hypothetical protein